jgi:hypothetical protein
VQWILHHRKMIYPAWHLLVLGRFALDWFALG